MNEIIIKTEFIKLQQLLKLAEIMIRHHSLSLKEDVMGIVQVQKE